MPTKGPVLRRDMPCRFFEQELCCWGLGGGGNSSAGGLHLGALFEAAQLQCVDCRGQSESVRRSGTITGLACDGLNNHSLWSRVSGWGPGSILKHGESHLGSPSLASHTAQGTGKTCASIRGSQIESRPYNLFRLQKPKLILSKTVCKSNMFT